MVRQAGDSLALVCVVTLEGSDPLAACTPSMASKARGLRYARAAELFPRDAVPVETRPDQGRLPTNSSDQRAKEYAGAVPRGRTITGCDRESHNRASPKGGWVLQGRFACSTCESRKSSSQFETVQRGSTPRFRTPMTRGSSLRTSESPTFSDPVPRKRPPRRPCRTCLGRIAAPVSRYVFRRSRPSPRVSDAECRPSTRRRFLSEPDDGRSRSVRTP